MRVFNAMEPLVAEALHENWSDINMPCKCDTCKNDVIAITLNSLKPRYVSKDYGMAFVKAQYFDKQMKADMYVKIGEAVRKVAENPQCENYNFIPSNSQL
ncbi:late competence development ComFB family protein [Bacillus timonensis]|uniref:late competence development ComFB family protein n=1 Tax=Bacillus timonensis TaxID=1033734 RepID=UPI000288742D|nr:competence protein ComFB [Bacillus timonensis]